jgi:hypothetical protein
VLAEPPVTVVTPPLSDKIASARAPAVDTLVPAIVVEAPVLVKTPYIAAPWVEIVVSVSFATPPDAKVPKGPL